MNFGYVLVGLSNVIGEFLHAIVEAREVFTKFAEFVFDDMNLLTRFDIFHHRPGSIQHRHQRCRRDNPNPSLHRIVDNFRMIGVNLGEHGFRGNEHHRAIGCFPGKNILRADGVDVIFNVVLELPLDDAAFRGRDTTGKHAVIIF